MGVEHELPTAPKLQRVDVPDKRVFNFKEPVVAPLAAFCYVSVKLSLGDYQLFCFLGLYRRFCLRQLGIFEPATAPSGKCVTESTSKETFPVSSCTCIVKTPSSWEDSFFIWSAKTCASSKIENSVSASQYPQESAEQIKARLHDNANKPPWTWRCLSRKVARALAVKAADLSPVRIAMTAVGPQAGETPSLSWWRQTKTSRQTTSTTLRGEVHAPFLCGLHNVQKRRPSQLPEVPHERKRRPRAKDGTVFILADHGVGDPSSIRRSNSWKSGKVRVSRRFTTMGVKVGGVETRESHRRLDFCVSGSGFGRWSFRPLRGNSLVLNLAFMTSL